MQPSIDRDGYHQVTLYRNNERGYFKVHQLVILAFVGECPKGLECCHNEGVPSNNRRNNLRYDTPAGNQADRALHGIQSRGQKLTEKQVKRILKMYTSGNHTQQSLADKFGVSQPAIGYIVRGESWSHVPG